MLPMRWYQKHKMMSWFCAGTVAAVALGGILYYFHHPPLGGAIDISAQGMEKSAPSEPMRVKVVYPKEGGVERLVRRPATVQAFDFADLYAKVSGYLSNQEVDIGSRVKKGEVLAEVYAPEKQADVKKAQADLEKAIEDAAAAEARVTRTKADRTAAEAHFHASKARLAADVAYKEFRVKQAKRYRGLLADRAINAELVDEQEDRLQAAIETVNADREAVASAKAKVDAADAYIKQAQADYKDAQAAVGVAQAVLQRAKVWADYTKIRSPYTGVITQRNFHNGDFIRDASQGGVQSVLAVARTDKMRIIVQVPDRDVPYLKVGQAADLTIDTLPGHPFQGKVARKAYREVYETRTMRTEVDINNPDELLEDGMYGEITIHLGREKGLRLPSKCMFGSGRDEKRSVFVVRENRAHEIKVKVGMDDGIEATIRDGLSMSDQVVVERPPGLVDGMRIEVIRDRSAEKNSEK
jgi:HlyD family secretion protein